MFVNVSGILLTPIAELVYKFSTESEYDQEIQ